MLSIITFKYAKPTYRTQYEAKHVNSLYRNVLRVYPHPFRFFCVTDDPKGLDSAIEYVPLWKDHFNLVNPSHPTSRPNCYPRLKLFDIKMREIFGDRFVSLDLDMVLIKEADVLWHRPEEFVIYDAKGDDHYNGSMFLMTAGARQQVWDRFDPVLSPKLTTAANMRGSDQAWIRYCLAPDAATWTNEEGAYAYLHIIPPSRERRSRPLARWKLPRNGSLPEGARVVIFAGEFKPWDRAALVMSPWIRDYYD
jgi:hypothetical protein